MNKNLLATFVFILFSYLLKAQMTCTATATGLWANAGTWTCKTPTSAPVSIVPPCGASIIIPLNTTVTIGSQQDYSTCTPTCNGMVLNVNGWLKFQNGNKLKFPCCSGIATGPQGSITPGTGGASSNYIEICNVTVWNADSNTAPPNTCFPKPCNVLPIELIAFTGNLEVKVVFINWKTITEVNNGYYDIEKSSDGVAFTKVTSVPSKAPNGNYRGLLSYSAVDNDLKHPLYYYRLKQVDLDGTVRYTNTISVKIYSPEFKIFPNPNNGQFSIDVPTAMTNQKLDVKLTDQLGHTVLNSNYELINDNITGAKLSITPEKPLSKGIYICSITFNGSEYRLKLVVN